MKKMVLLLVGIVFFLSVLHAQEAPPQAFSFKAVITKNSAPVANKTVYLRISILQDNINGLPVYAETFAPTTNEFGQVDLMIGRGTWVSGDFTTIEWSQDEYFLQIEYALKQRDPYLPLSTTQLLSVPYALYTGEAGNGFAAEYTEGEMRPVLNMTNGHVTFGGEPDWWSRLRVDGGLGITPGPGNFWGATFVLDARSQEGGLQYNISSLSEGSSEGAGKFQIADIDGISKFILHNGHTGINNLNPEYSLDVTGDINFSGSLLQNGSPYGGDYDALINKPDLSAYATKEYVDNLLTGLGILPNNFAGILTDIEGNNYKTVKIGAQTWMAENLETGSYNDGTEIPLGTYGVEWFELTTPAYCWYDDEDTYHLDTYLSYHKLYNWYAINTGNLCPAGWHVSTYEDWTELIDYLGGTGVAGGKLKEAGTRHWYSPNEGATNESGFTAFPGMARFNDFSSNRQYGQFWMSTETDSEEAWGVTLYYLGTGVSLGRWGKSYGRPVRCVKD